MKQVSFLVFEVATGAIRLIGSAPEDTLGRYTEGDDSQRLVTLTDTDIVVGDYVVDLAKLEAASEPCAFADITVEILPPPEVLLQRARDDAEWRLDKHFAGMIASELGPLADVHVRKRRQAEAGGGPLVDDETDRAAILDRAAEQDARLAEFDRRRRRLKAEIRTARTVDEVAAALADVSSIEGVDGIL